MADSKPAHRPNGHKGTVTTGVPAGFRPDAPAVSLAELAARADAEQQQRAALEAQQAQQAQIHDAIAGLLENDPAALLQKLPDMYGQAIANAVTNGAVQAVQALQALPVKTMSRLCALCLEQRIAWNTRHAAELEAAQQAVMTRTGATDRNDPRVANADLVPLLPENLRPGAVPDGLPLMFDAVTTVQGTDVCPGHHPAAPQASRGRLITVPGISVHAAAQLAMTGAPGMPGAAAG